MKHTNFPDEIEHGFHNDDEVSGGTVLIILTAIALSAIILLLAKVVGFNF